MIHFFIGTKAQLIKTAPIMIELERNNIPFRYIDSGQHAEFTKSIRKVFGIREPDICLGCNKKDITSIVVAASWFFKLIMISILNRKWLREKVYCGGGICLIHGDTLSAVLGMKMAKAAGLKVGHIEAGLRSFNIWDPFPEELIRIYCMKRCDILFAPSDEACINLDAMKVSGEIVSVDGNTVVDSLRLVENAQTIVDIPNEEFALATCHRLETITKRKRLCQVTNLLNRISEQIKIVFVIHKPTRRYLQRFGLMNKLSSNIQVLGVQDYVNFTSLLKAAKIVLTDGGSIQEECTYLNKPCLILRSKTERPDGLDKNAVLWNFSESELNRFLDKSWDSVPPDTKQWPRPSQMIVKALENYLNNTQQANV